MTPQDIEPKGWNGLKRRIAKLTQDVASLRNITLQRSGFADTISIGQQGVTINLREIPKASTSVGGDTESIHAFQLVLVSADDLAVRQGTISSIIPTIGGVELATDYEDNSLPLPGTGTREYWLKATVDTSGAVTAVTIENAEPSVDSATQAKLLLGTVETDSGDVITFNSNLSGSQAHASCGEVHYFGLV